MTHCYQPHIVRARIRQRHCSLITIGRTLREGCRLACSRQIVLADDATSRTRLLVTTLSPFYNNLLPCLHIASSAQSPRHTGDLSALADNGYHTPHGRQLSAIIGERTAITIRPYPECSARYGAAFVDGQRWESDSLSWSTQRLRDLEGVSPAVRLNSVTGTLSSSVPFSNSHSILVDLLGPLWACNECM